MLVEEFLDAESVFGRDDSDAGAGVLQCSQYGLGSRKSTVLTVICVSASFRYSALNPASCPASVTPVRMEKSLPESCR